MLSVNRFLAVVASFFFIVIIGSCGGGGGGDEQQTPTVPSPTVSNVVFAQIEGSETSIITLATTNDAKEAIGVLVERDVTGNPLRVSGAIYLSPQGYAGKIEFGADGLPTSLSDSAGNKYVYTDYTSNTVQMSLYDSTGTPLFMAPVRLNVDTDGLSQIKSLYSSITFVTASSVKGQVSAAAFSRHELATALKYVSLASSWIGCATDTYTSVASFGILAPIAASSCSSALLKTLINLSGDQEAGIAMGLLSAGACSVGSVFSCISSFASAAAGLIEPPSPYSFSISGRVTLNGVGLAGVTIALIGSVSASTATDSNGDYVFTVQNGSYTITPSLTGYVFNPNSLSVTVNSAAITGQDFMATSTPFTAVDLWPMFGHDSQHTGRSPYAGSATMPTVEWTNSLFDSTYTQSILSPIGMIYGIGSYLNGAQNKIFGRELSTGVFKQFTADSNIYATPAVDSSGVVYFGDDSGHIYALNSDLSLKWKKNGYFGTSNYLSAPATVGTDGNVYMVGTDSIINNAIICVGPDGALKWKYKPGDTFVSSLSPAIGTDGTIYIGVKNDGNGTGGLVALNADGTLKWKHTFEGLSGEEWKGGVSPILTPAIGPDDTIYIGTLWYFYAINPDGSLKWLRLTAGSHYILAVPAVGSDGTIYVDLDGVFSALRPGDGSTKWTFTSFGALSFAASIAIDSNGVVYAGSRDYLFAIKPDGTLKWQFYGSYAYFTSPKIGQDGTIYVHHELYKLSALK